MSLGIQEVPGKIMEEISFGIQGGIAGERLQIESREISQILEESREESREESSKVSWQESLRNSVGKH